MWTPTHHYKIMGINMELTAETAKTASKFEAQNDLECHFML
jgi:hypothetical protein